MHKSNEVRTLSTIIETMRFPLIAMVIFAHMLPFDTPKVDLSFAEQGIYTFVTELLSHNLARLAVRCYFFIAGFFMFEKLSQNLTRNYAASLEKKMMTLLVPYLFWNLVLVGAVYGKCYISNAVGVSCAEATYVQSQSFYQLFWTNPVNFPLWYMRDLMCMTVLAPAFYFFFKYTGKYGFILLLVLYLANLESNVPGLSTTAITFFGAGAFFSLRKLSLLAQSNTIKRCFLIAASGLLILSTLANGTSQHEYVFRLFASVGVPALIFLFEVLCKSDRFRKTLVTVAPSTFFIYVVHEVYIINWLKGAWLRLFGIQPGWSKLLGYFLFGFLCLTICFLLFLLLRRVAPKFLGVITGGRVYPYLSSNGESSISAP